ncbi:MAG: HAD family hydrolase [Clostridia bacterium]
MDKYIMWDFDNTLAYREGMWTQTMMDIMSELSIKSINRDSIREFMKKGFPWNNYELSHQELMGDLNWWDYLKMYFIRSLIDLELPADIATIVAGRIKNKYLDISYWKVFSDTVNTLDLLKDKGYKHIVLSNHVPELESLVKNLNLAKYFDEIISSGIVGYEKPNKMIFNYAKNKLPKDSSVIMVGDNYKADILGANQNDIQAILVRKPNTFNYGNYFEILDNAFIDKIEVIFGGINND